MATQLSILNNALLKIGVSQTIVSLSEVTREAYTASVIWAPARQETLRAYPWAFATAYADLYLTAGPFWNTDPAVLILVQAWDAAFAYAIGDVVRVASVNYYAVAASTNQTPPNATSWSTDQADAPDFASRDWRYAYRQPSDALLVRRLAPTGGMGREFSATPIPFRRGRDANGLLIYTHEIDAQAEYTLDVDATDDFNDALFEEALSWKLAEKFGPSLSRDPKAVQLAAVMFRQTIDQAEVVDAREQQQPKPGEADWIAGR